MVIKNILIFVGGFATGCACAYTVVRKAVMAEAEREIEEIREFYEEKLEDGFKANVVLQDKLSEVTEAENGELETSSMHYLRTSAMEKPPLESLVRNNERRGKGTIVRKPHTISIEAFMNDDELRDGRALKKVTIVHHSDNVFTDENGDVMMGPAEFIGEDAYETLFRSEGGIDILYCRNEELGVDYEIECAHEPYFPEPEEEEEAPKPARKPRKKKVEVPRPEDMEEDEE